VRQDPGPELQAERALLVERRERAEQEAVAEEQQDHRHARREAEGRAEHPDLRVVGEEEHGEGAQRVRRVLVIVERRAQLLGGGGRRPALRVALVDQRVEARGIVGGEGEAGQDAQDHHGRGQREVPAQLAHHRGEAPAHEGGGGLERRPLGSVDAHVRAGGQALQVFQHVAVERDHARDRQRREGGAVEHGQPRQLRRRQHPQPAGLAAGDERGQLDPGRLALAAELDRLHTSSRRLMSR
jgi:hypothetical protein